jgi:tetratricopeptide (TPR) repeat protein
MKRLSYILAVLLLCAGNLLAADAPANFSAANQLYAEGKFPQAALGYENILNAGIVSPNLFFNDGNAEFKAGNVGRAIAAYRQAALLSPRDADVRANLNFARNQVQGSTIRESRWQNWLGSLTLNEWTALAAIALWLMFGLYGAMQLSPALKPVLQTPARLAVVAVIVFCGCLGATATVHFTSPVAVVVLPDAVTRTGPFDDAQNAFAVHDGAELPVLDQRNGWVQVGDGAGRSGWIPSSQVEVLPSI